MSYYPFTKEEREKARTTDLAEFLRSQGGEIKRSGSENMWLSGGQKVTLRGNLWFHQYEQVGGDAADFACKFYGLNYPEAVKLLLDSNVASMTVPMVPMEKKAIELPPKNRSMSRVYAYLLHQRGIDKEVLDAFVFRNMIYEDEKFHNAVFVGYDMQGIPRHAHKRSTAAKSSFKGNAPGSQPEWSFHWRGGSEKLFLFEAPIDMLAFISLNKVCWRNHSYAAACSVSDKVMWQCMKDQPYIRTVYLCFDSDERGQLAVKNISEKLKEKNINYEILIPKYKDWDEDLLHFRKCSQ